jgi:hypothetical protein
MGNDRRRPDEPTEPPDMLKVSREVEGGVGDGDDDERRPEKHDEPSNDPAIEPRDPKDVQVEPGGETSEAERSKHTAHEDADAEVDGEAIGKHRDVQVEVESAQTRRDTTREGERARATAHTGSTMTDEETVGISIPYLVVTAYLSIATSHHSFTLVLLSDILSILQVQYYLLQTHINFPRFLPIFPDFLE